MGDKGYFLHELGCCETERVGTGTRIWAFSHVLPGARIGESCNICDHVFIENDVVVGDRVTVKSGVQLWDGTTLEDDVFIGPNATFTNDQFPRSQQYLDKYPRTVVCHGASVGANATILPGLTIGRHAMVGAGAVVTRSIPPPCDCRWEPGANQGLCWRWAFPSPSSHGWTKQTRGARCGSHQRQSGDTAPLTTCQGPTRQSQRRGV